MLLCGALFRSPGMCARPHRLRKVIENILCFASFIVCPKYDLYDLFTNTPHMFHSIPHIRIDFFVPLLPFRSSLCTWNNGKLALFGRRFNSTIEIETYVVGGGKMV